MNATRDSAALVGRVVLALMFVVSGVGKIGGFTDVTVYMASAGLPAVDPLLEILLVLTILIELGGGAAIMFGWKTRSAALLILFFTTLVTLVFHRFWAAPSDEATVQQLMLMKNVSVMGGLLVLFAFGPGKYAVEHRVIRHR